MKLNAILYSGGKSRLASETKLRRWNISGQPPDWFQQWQKRLHSHAPLILRSWSWPWTRPRTRPWTRGWSLVPRFWATVILMLGGRARRRLFCPFFLPVFHRGRRTTARLLFYTVLLGSTARITFRLHLGTALWTGLAFCWMRPGLARAWLGFAGGRTGPAVAWARFASPRLPSSRSRAGVVTPSLAMGAGPEKYKMI